MTTVIIMRGIPGSGKSTWVEENEPDSHYCSADRYFVGEDGVYRFNPANIGEAHKSCMRHFLDALFFCEEIDHEFNVVVDNTNTQLWELSPYMAVALARGHKVKIVTVHCDFTTAAERNTHGVPEQAVKAMFERFEHIPPFWEVEKVDVGEKPNLYNPYDI